MIYLVDLESVESRYTSEWKNHFPEVLKEKTNQDVSVISGTEITATTTKGAFLNFGATNIYKADQVREMGNLFYEEKITEQDHFVFADAWHPGIINLRYMADLLNIPIKIHALWHAGSYDPHDFLGRTIPDFVSAKKYVPWIRHIEKGLFEAIDYNYFASDFHIDMFLENLLDVEERIGRIRYMRTGKITKSGWPMEYIGSTLKKEKKQDIILFPHRLAPEKQPDIFKDLQNEMPEYEFILCQEQTLQKHEYHDLLSKAKMVFSANLQETLGISCFEILAAGGMPLVPNRLSYTEMYRPAFKYPTEWSSSYESYLENKDKLITRIKNMMKYYNQYNLEIEKNFESLQKNYFSCDRICDNLK